MKYLEILRIEFNQGIKSKWDVVGRFTFYGVVLFVFSSLWKQTADQNPQGVSPAQMLWYLAFTELVVLSLSSIHIKISEDVQSGNLGYSLVRPISYFWAMFFRGMGESLSKLLFLTGACFLFPYVLTGEFAFSLLGAVFLAPVIIFAIAVSTLFQVGIGIIAFWIQDSQPLYWIWQKFSFILGGMILPLTLYPDWLVEFAMWTPFPYILYFPAMGLVKGDLALLYTSVVGLSIWLSLAYMINFLIYRKAQQGLVINGG